MMSMNPSMMTGDNGISMMLFGWIIYLLFIVLLVLGISALWKYISK